MVAVEVVDPLEVVENDNRGEGTELVEVDTVIY